MCLLLQPRLEEFEVSGFAAPRSVGGRAGTENKSQRSRSSRAHLLLSYAVGRNNRKRIAFRVIVFHRDMFCTQFSVKYVPFTRLMFQLHAEAAANDIAAEGLVLALPGELRGFCH